MSQNETKPNLSNNWLDSKIISCSKCGQELHWLWHSGFYDETFYYCTKCPKRVEVSKYDSRVSEFSKKFGKVSKKNLSTFLSKLHAFVESQLIPCDCGGCFEYSAPRRCLRCYEILPQTEPGRDVWPPESADERFSQDYESLKTLKSLIRSGNIWK